jgi:Domain of Unknown Function (DUF1206)
LLDASPRRDIRPSPPTDGVAGAALEAQRSAAFCGLVRAGFVARGVTYGVIAGIAAALAAGVGSAGGTPNQQGALTFIAQAPLGFIVVMAAAVGLLAYALWKLALGIIGHGPEGSAGHNAKDRIANVAGGIVYLSFFAVAVHVLIGASGNETSEQRQATAGVLGWPAGRFIVGLVGAILIGVSLFQIWEALCDQFTDDNKLLDMGRARARAFLVIGRVGLCARALVFVLIGYFFIRAAVEYRPSNGIGLDGTLAAVHGEPFGAVLLAAVAAGLLTFAVFSFFEARYRRL